MVPVKLSKQYHHGETVFDTVELREPTYKELFMDELGTPREWQPSSNGGVVVTYPGVVDAYMQRLVVSPGYECLTRISAIDALRLQKAICDFFREPADTKT